jgi:hypothetical protein
LPASKTWFDIARDRAFGNGIESEEPHKATEIPAGKFDEYMLGWRAGRESLLEHRREMDRRGSSNG